jgi:hypothetical protein
MIRKFTRLTLVGAALAASTAVALSTGGTSAFATPPTGAAALSPGTGTTANSFTLLPPSGASCTSSGANGYSAQTYFISRNADASALTFGALGPTGAGTFVQPLYDTGGNLVAPGTSSSPLGLIDGIPALSFSSQVGDPTVVAGQYKIGITCVVAAHAEPTGSAKYWEVPVTISNVTATSFSYATGWAPDAPVLGGTLTVGDQTVSGSFTAAASTPVQDHYDITAVPQGGGTTVTKQIPAAGAFSLLAADGVVNGKQYAVTVTAHNTVGNSPASNSVLSPTVNPGAYAPVTGLAGVPGVGTVDLSWTAPAGDSGRTGYTVGQGSAAVGPFTTVSSTVPAGATTYQVTGLSAGTTYYFQVTANYPSPFAGAPAVAGPLVPTDATVIVQDISVTRPVGALVLTQRCGVNGDLPAVAADSANGFGALALLPASANQTGTAPHVGTLSGPLVSTGEFDQYPYPVDANGVPNPTYPTHCGVNLGSGKLITSGPRAGQYFTATGNINQVTVVDTRDTDPGFVINGTASDFVNGTSTFSGNYLGWQPIVSGTSGTTLEGYDQTVAAGTTLQPSLATGLATAKPLATAAAGQGLGIATLDARLKLLIPLTARNGGFAATLTFTTA